MTTVTLPFARDQDDRDHPDWCDPFPEPRALPGGWDLAEPPRYEQPPNSGREYGRSIERPNAAAPGALAVEWIERRPDPFPECNTFPGGWDLADVLALERERMETRYSEPEQVNFLLLIDRLPCLNR